MLTLAKSTAARMPTATSTAASMLDSDAAGIASRDALTRTWGFLGILDYVCNITG
jgi:hypothetical protein